METGLEEGEFLLKRINLLLVGVLLRKTCPSQFQLILDLIYFTNAIFPSGQSMARLLRMKTLA